MSCLNRPRMFGTSHDKQRSHHLLSIVVFVAFLVLPGSHPPTSYPHIFAPSRLPLVFHNNPPSSRPFLTITTSQPHSLLASSFFLCSRHFEIPPVYRSDPHPIVYYNMCQAISTCPLFSFCKK